MSNFYLHHEKLGDEYLATRRFAEAKDAYAYSLQLNPANFLLIARLAKEIESSPELYAFNELLTDAVPNALRFRGHNESVFYLAGAASFLQKRIMCAEMACKTRSPFKLSWQSHVAINSNPPARSSRYCLALLTCVWQRPALTEIVLDYYQDLQARLADQIDLVMVAVGSEGVASRRLCEARGFHYHEFPNQPLSAKWDHGLKCCRKYQPDGVVIVGSDDLLSDALFRSYADLLDQGTLCCGIIDGVFFDLQNPSGSIHWQGYGGRTNERGMPWRLNEAIGMGRLFARPLLEYLDYSLWRGAGINKGLDKRAKNRLISFGIRPVLEGDTIQVLLNNRRYAFGQLAIPLARCNGLAVDIKQLEQNITTMPAYQSCPEAFKCLQDPWGLLARYFPHETVEALQVLAKGLS
jgi:hypothetical protein